MATGAIHDSDLPSYVVSEAIAEFLPVRLGTNANEVDLADGATDSVIGFAVKTQSTIGGAVAIKTNGKTLALAGSGGFTKGAKLTPTTAGALIITTTAANLVCAIAQEAVSAGEYGEVEIIAPSIRYDSF